MERVWLGNVYALLCPILPLTKMPQELKSSSVLCMNAENRSASGFTQEEDTKVDVNRFA